MSDDADWARFEAALNQPLLRVDDLQPACVRLDRTTASGHWTVTEDGLFEFGHSTDHRPDLPQVKVMLSVLYPLGMPVATDVVPRQRADAPLYVPAIIRVRESLASGGCWMSGTARWEQWRLGPASRRAAIPIWVRCRRSTYRWRGGRASWPLSSVGNTC